MKIGIMTFWWSEDNYGQILQCYALQKYLRNAGHDAYLIRYDPRGLPVKTPLVKKIIKALNPVKLCNFLSYQIKKRTVYNKIQQSNALRKFDEFRNKYITQSEKVYYSYNELLQNPPEANVYIVGSDQVWNFDFSIYRNHPETKEVYLLNFGSSKIRRIAYAASFGQEKSPMGRSEDVIPLLKKFNYISLREKSGVSICRQYGIANAEWAPDPTMLLKADAYRSLCGNEPIQKPEQAYCLLYLLKNKHNFSIQKIYDWAAQKNFKIVYISGNAQYDTYKKTYATILEWLFLIDTAECVITNSYHCSVFSLLFQKKFGVISLIDKYSGMNSRFESLWELFGIQKRFLGTDFSVLDTDINWQSVSIAFEKIHTTDKLLDAIQE
jgi:hypothetical protein